jgi:4-amino-4-deoxy-L-arabinose transferase-like glycosyltransferase
VDLLLSDELRLTYALLLQAAILAGAWRFVSRRLTTDWADRAADILLLALLVQYAAVTLPGLLGILNPLTIAGTTLVLSAALFLAPPKGVAWASVLACPSSSRKKDHGQTSLPMPLNYTLLAATLFALGYIVAIDVNQSGWPVTANDALTYHFPAATHWLRTGHLSLFETWFFNPANTYSPLAGSTFIAWWIAPMGNDVLARNVQSPALLLIFFAALRLIRALGVRGAVAALLALALLLARPFIRQSIIEKDDLYLTAFFTCAAAACAADRLRDPLAPWRVGIALGLMLATKYTALLALPPLLLLIDAPVRARWSLHRYAIAIALILLIAGPWYLRNVLLTHNPLYPMRTLGLPGLFASARSTQFASPGSTWTLLTTRDQSLPRAPMLLVLLGTLVALARQFRRVRSEPLARLCLLGPPLVLLIFVTSSPYAEVRFLYPAFVLLFAATGITFRKPQLQLVVASLLLFVSWLTAFDLVGLRTQIILGFVATAFIVTLVGLGFAWTLSRFPTRRRTLIASGASLAIMALAASIYVAWPAYMKSCRELAIVCYRTQYGPAADAWRFVRDELPPTETLAYANTFLIHPMEGFENRRPVVYIPTRRSITHLRDLPPIPGRLAGEQIVPALAAALTADTDEAGWLQHLADSRATHLIVFHHDVTPNPPELAIIQSHPDRFERLFQNDAASVFRLRR